VLGGSLQAELAALNEPDEKLVAKVREEWQKRHDQVITSGGLHIIGTERHESRRIDNQLRGRSGRQGDPGSSRFYLSLEDNLMRIFASERVAGMMQRLGMQDDEAIEHPWVTKAIENAQRKVEGHNFDMRKSLLEYDDVANDQRKVIYSMRDEYMASEDILDTIKAIQADVLNAVIDTYIPPQSVEEQWDIPGLEEALEGELTLKLPLVQWLKDDDTLHEESLRARILVELEKQYAEKEARAGAQVLRHFEKAVMLQVLDSQWKDHLATMDQLRQGIHLRGYAQKNPKQEYKREAFELFREMLARIKNEVISVLSKVVVRSEEEVHAMEEQRRQEESQKRMDFKHESVGGGDDNKKEEEHEPFVRDGRKVGRNEPCPCGSGKKYKQCHGKLA
jgi:preprotein translocase subunit SecA